MPKEGVLTAGVPRQLFPAFLVSATVDRNAWDVTLDGQRFLINQGAGTAQGQAPITVVVNWLAGQDR
jgi:hypothetical protein